jgi:hypothetical protein
VSIPGPVPYYIFSASDSSFPYSVGLIYTFSGDAKTS